MPMGRGKAQSFHSFLNVLGLSKWSLVLRLSSTFLTALSCVCSLTDGCLSKDEPVNMMPHFPEGREGLPQSPRHFPQAHRALTRTQVHAFNII